MTLVSPTPHRHSLPRDSTGFSDKVLSISRSVSSLSLLLSAEILFRERVPTVSFSFSLPLPHHTAFLDRKQYSNLFVISVFPSMGLNQSPNDVYTPCMGVHMLLKFLSVGKICFFPWDFRILVLLLIVSALS